MKNGVFPYDKCPEGYKLPIYALSFDVLPEKIRSLFVRRFSNNEYVDAQAWFDALCEYEARLKTCKSNHNHEYRKGLRKCPYCSATTNTAKMLATGAMPRASLAKDGTKKTLHLGRFAFWIVTLFLAFLWQLVGCYVVGCGDQLIGEVSDYIGYSYQGFNLELLKINCTCGLISTTIYNCVTQKKRIRFKNYLLSQLTAILGFICPFILYVIFLST